MVRQMEINRSHLDDLARAHSKQNVPSHYETVLWLLYSYNQIRRQVITIELAKDAFSMEEGV